MQMNCTNKYVILTEEISAKQGLSIDRQNNSVKLRNITSITTKRLTSYSTHIKSNSSPLIIANLSMTHDHKSLLR
jgi:hypothetical protein